LIFTNIIPCRFVGGYDKEEKAARVYDLVALKVLHYIIPID